MSHFSFCLQIWGLPFKGAPALITFLLKQLLLFYSFQMHDSGYKTQKSSTGHVFKHTSTTHMHYVLLWETLLHHKYKGHRCEVPCSVLALLPYEYLLWIQRIKVWPYLKTEMSQKHLKTFSLKIWIMVILMKFCQKGNVAFQDNRSSLI